jgi:hypothetical protein
VTDQRVISDQKREFFVWVSPALFLIQNNLGLVGSFTGGPIIPGIDGPEGLLFVPNPNPKARQCSISPFHLGVIREYHVEYELEVVRYRDFRALPSRLHALYLLESREAAERYGDAHPDHVQGRILKRAETNGPYTYSIHDSAWIRFLRLPSSKDQETMESCAHGYWSGARITEGKFTSMGKPWTAPSVLEVLFYGRVDFPNRQLTSD